MNDVFLTHTGHRAHVEGRAAAGFRVSYDGAAPVGSWPKAAHAREAALGRLRELAAQTQAKADLYLDPETHGMPAPTLQSVAAEADPAGEQGSRRTTPWTDTTGGRGRC